MLATRGATTAPGRAPRAEELTNHRFRIRDVDADESHVTADGKQIDLFTEHVVELLVARRHVRLSDDARSLDLEALRLLVRDVDRRRARVTDHESVMSVLTERVTVSDVVTRSMTAAVGASTWRAVGRQVRTDSESRERVEFGDLEKEEEEEPLVTLPEDEVDGEDGGSEDGGQWADRDGLVIEEVECEAEDYGGQTGVNNVASSEGVPTSSERDEELQRRLSGLAPGFPAAFTKPDQSPEAEARPREKRKWCKKLHHSSQGAGILSIRPKHSRRPAHHRGPRPRGCVGAR